MEPVENLESEVRFLRDERRKQERALLDARLKLRKLQDKNANHLRRLQNFGSDEECYHSKCTLAVENIRNEVSALRKRIQETNAKKVEVERGIRCLGDVEADNAGLKRRLSQLEDEQLSMQNLIENKSVAISEARKRQHDQKAVLQSAISKRKIEIDELKNENFKLESSFLEAVQQRSKLKRDLEGLNQPIDNFEEGPVYKNIG